MKDYIFPEFRHFLHGGDYNPEQWMDTPQVWDEDMRLMKLSHCNEMSVGIFSWSKLEVRDGEFDFSWLDTILDKIHQNGGRVLLATPSGARPHWLADAYPEVLRVDTNGIRASFGKRHNHCPTSPAYRRYVRRIDEKLAERYADHPALIGWHISNEFNAEGCFCEECRRGFRDWLRKKYQGDIQKLNHEWWTTFWSHTYDSFDQIDPPSPIGDDFASLVLDWRRFLTDVVTDFVHEEKAAIRRFSDAPVTTNYMMGYNGINYDVLTREMDFISWDSYPMWHRYDAHGSQIEIAAETAMFHDRCRSFLNRPFVLMESTPSLVNWQPYNKLKRPGMHKLASLQAVAHGSDAVQYFQYRKSRGSNEKFHGAVVDHFNAENTRVFREVTELGKTLKKLDTVLGTHTRSRVALIYDTENDWAIEVAQGFQKDNKKYIPICKRIYRSLWRRGINVDVIDAHRDLDGYDLVIAPMLYMVYEDTVKRLTDYVAKGGTLLSGYMLGMVNENDLCTLDGFPFGTLKDVFGIWNEEIDTLYPDEKNAVLYDGKSYPVSDYCERIHPNATAEVLAVYEKDFYAGEPALVKNHYGEGTAYYLATRDDGALTDDLLGTLIERLGIPCALCDLPTGVTAHTREEDGERYLFVENYNAASASVVLPHPMRDMEDGRICEGTLALPPFGIRVLCDAV